MAVHGKSTFVSIADASASAVDMSSDMNQAGLSRSLDTAESTGFGEVAKKYVAGMEDATSSWSGFFTAAQDEVLSGLVDAFAAGTIDSTEMVYGPAGSATGKVKYTQQVIVTGYEVSGSVGDLVTATVSMQRTGPSVRGTFA
jgi:hypothetical protein